ncbi:MAG: hypothetical protein HQL01_02270 [Nitrospirae bacterium]|nr:hypothetical protein [Nitrospirota bacterium]
MKDTVTLLIYKDKSGKAKSLKMRLSTFRILWMAIIILPLVSVAASYLSVKLYKENKDMLIEMGAIVKENTKLRDSIKHNEAAGKTLPLPEKAIKPAETAEFQPTNEFEDKAVNTGKVDIENILVSDPGADRFTLYFEVVKGKVATEKISGYVFVMWKAADKYYSMPLDIAITAGVPASYSDGEKFDIRYRKPFTEKIPSDIKSIQLLYVLAYDEKGNIILKKNVKIM